MRSDKLRKIAIIVGVQVGILVAIIAALLISQNIRNKKNSSAQTVSVTPDSYEAMLEEYGINNEDYVNQHGESEVSYIDGIDTEDTEHFKPLRFEDEFDMSNSTSDSDAGESSEETSNSTSSAQGGSSDASSADNTDAVGETDSNDSNLSIEERVDAKLKAMTLDQKIYQMFIVTPESITGYAQVTAAGDTTRDSIAKFPVGGFVYFSSNLENPAQTKEMLSNTYKYGMDIEGLPLFLCVDEEGGTVTRVAQNSSFGVNNVGPMSAIQSSNDAYNAGKTIGSYLYDLGFNVDFAPDADVLTNDANTVIGNRSFGKDAQIVTDYASAYSNGLKSKNLLSCFKHFPGHGATTGDTHNGYASTDKSLTDLKASELKPFAVAEANNVDFVMVAHISTPTITGNDTPASLSATMVSGVLRGDLGYKGLIITDSLDMGAIVNNYQPGEAGVLAILAGCDILLMPADVTAAHDAIVEAINNGTLTESRIDESVRRIITKKLKSVREYE